MNTNTKALLAAEYIKVVKAFLKQSNVLGGKALAYHPDKSRPLNNKNWFNFGDALVTTGFCVCVSQAILDDPIFKTYLVYRKAKAKLVSIDIKEQFYGFCKPSYFANKWHTAIYVEDSGHQFIIDPTCAQFGNEYVGKLVWDFSTWCETFRSATDQHVLTDFNGMQIADTTINAKKADELTSKILETDLFDNVLTSSAERKLVASFLLEGYSVFNRKVFSGGLKDTDLKYINNVQNALMKFELATDPNPRYCIFSFESPNALKKVIKLIADTQEKEGDAYLPFYALTSKSKEEAAEYNFARRDNTTLFYDAFSSNLNSNSTVRHLCVVFRRSKGNLLKTHYIKNADMLIPAGVRIGTDLSKDFYNFNTKSTERPNEKSNTWILEVDVLD